MKFLIEPINDTDCRIVDIDCSDLQGQAVDELTIPATVEQDGKTYAVKEVGDGVCHTNKSDDNSAKYASLRRLKKIIFSEGIEAIGGVMGNDGSNADERGNADTLTEVVLPSTLKVIGAQAFCNCKELSSINIPAGVEEIGENAFADCCSLSFFQWPKSLRNVNLSAFTGLQVPKDENGYPTFVLTVPDTIETIEGACKWNYLKECIVPLKVWEVFDSSELPEKIYEINIPEGVTKITGQYISIRKIILPSTIELIGRSAFYHSIALDVISELPASLKTIGDYAFMCAYKSDEPKEIIIPSSVESVGQDAFYTDSRKIKLLGDDATMKMLMGQPGALNGTAVEAIDIPEGATEVNVKNCPELERLTIPSTVTKITVISNCPKLKSLIIPDSVTLIEEISQCKSLETLQLSSNLEQLKSLSDCPNIKELHLPDSIKKFKDDPDDWKSVLDHLHARIYASPEVWKILCSNKNGLCDYAPENKNLEIPEGVESIAQSLLLGSEIEDVSLPSTLKAIGQSAFLRCKKLKSLTIPAGVKVLPSNALSGCNSLEAIEFADGSQLEEIGYEAFSKTALKQLTLPDGLKKLSGEVFKDCETIESVTFPASMTDFGFSANDWGDSTTPFVRCKNLKYVVFLADDPATAVYPVALGKLCDWYVPDHMVEHVKAFIEKAKADNPKVKGVGAKNVKTLSKLKGGTPAAAPKKNAPKKQTLTQPILLEAFGIEAIYEFAVDEADMNMLDNGLDMSILATRYLREKAKECSFRIVDNRQRGSTWVVEELSLNTKVNSATDNLWHCTPKTTVEINFADASNLPEDFPTNITSEVAKYGGFQKLFASRCPNYDRQLPEGAPAYLKVKLSIRVQFDFMIGEKEKFNVKKISVMKDWDLEDFSSRKCWRFALMYNGRYIPATSITLIAASSINATFVNGAMHGGVMYGESTMGLTASKQPDGKEELDVPAAYEFDGVKFECEMYKAETIPFSNEILSLMK